MKNKIFKKKTVMLLRLPLLEKVAVEDLGGEVISLTYADVCRRMLTYESRWRTGDSAFFN